MYIMFTQGYFQVILITLCLSEASFIKERMKRGKQNDEIQTSQLDGKTECGKTITDATEGIVESPGYPLKYDPNTRCEWLIKSPGDHDTIHINFIDLDIEESNQCLYDFISVTAEELGTQRFCGNQASSIGIITAVNSGWVRIRFSSDGSVEKSGFRLSYRVESAPDMQQDNIRSSPITPVKSIPDQKDIAKTAAFQTTRFDQLYVKEQFRFAESSKSPNLTTNNDHSPHETAAQIHCYLSGFENMFAVGDTVKILCAHDGTIINATHISCMSNGKWNTPDSCKPISLKGEPQENVYVLSRWQIAMLIVTGVSCAVYVIFTSYLFVAQRRRVSAAKCPSCNRLLNRLRRGQHLSNSNYETEDCTFT